MTYSYHFDDNYPVVFIYVRGQDSFKDHIERIEKITGDRRWSNGHNVLIEFSDNTEYDLSESELREIAIKQDSKHQDIGKGKLAVVAGEDITFGLSRMWEMLLGPNPSMEVMIFRARKDATQWLDLPLDYSPDK
jgi:hypothetical protein